MEKPRKNAAVQLDEITLDALLKRCRVGGPEAECLEWITDGKNEVSKIFPQIKVAGKVLSLRRVLYVKAGNEIAPNRRLVPTCGNKFCVEPEHQEALTESQKQQRVADAGGWRTLGRRKKIADRARESGRAKITMEQAEQIRASDETEKVLGERYGIHPKRAGTIRRGLAWKEYDNPYLALVK